MKLEDRYFVIKHTDFDLLSADECLKHVVALRKAAEACAKAREAAGKAPLQAVVIEHDWPEYPVALGMLAARVDKPINRTTDAQYEESLGVGEGIGHGND